MIRQHQKIKMVRIGTIAHQDRRGGRVWLIEYGCPICGWKKRPPRSLTRGRIYWCEGAGFRSDHTRLPAEGPIDVDADSADGIISAGPRLEAR